MLFFIFQFFVFSFSHFLPLIESCISCIFFLVKWYFDWHGSHGMYVKNLDVVMTGTTLTLAMDAMGSRLTGAGRNVLMCLCPSVALDQVKKYTAGVTAFKKWSDWCTSTFDQKRDHDIYVKKRAAKAEWENFQKMRDEGKIIVSQVKFAKRKSEFEDQIDALDRELERFGVETKRVARKEGQKAIDQTGGSRYIMFERDVDGTLFVAGGDSTGKPIQSQYIAYDKSLDWTLEPGK